MTTLCHDFCFRNTRTMYALQVIMPLDGPSGQGKLGELNAKYRQEALCWIC